MNQESESDRIVLNDIKNFTSDATTDSQQLQNGTHQEVSHVTYIIGQGKEIIMHRFELDLSPDQEVEMVIKSRDFRIINCWMYLRSWRVFILAGPTIDGLAGVSIDGPTSFRLPNIKMSSISIFPTACKAYIVSPYSL